MKKAVKKENIQKAIVIGGSAGSIPVLSKILEGLPANFPYPIIVCLHRMKNVAEGMVELFDRTSLLKVVEPNDKDAVIAGKVYLAPSNYHMLIEKGFTFSLSTDILENYSRPSIDITIEYTALSYRENTVGVLLTGANKDGAAGMAQVKKHGGITIVQDPVECVAPYMPLAALEKKCVDYVLTTDKIIEFLKAL